LNRLSEPPDSFALTNWLFDEIMFLTKKICTPGTFFSTDLLFSIQKLSARFDSIENVNFCAKHIYIFRISEKIPPLPHRNETQRFKKRWAGEYNACHEMLFPRQSSLLQVNYQEDQLLFLQ